MELTANSTVKTPEAESQTPTGIHLPESQTPFSNGLLKRHAPLHLHHPVVVAYKECLKNHAASLGGHAVDGCGEFMPSPATNPADPTSLKCAACGCHRNFHRREPDDALAPPMLEFRPLHRHHPPPLENSGGSPNDSPSPPPISSAYYPSAPHILMALSHGGTPISAVCPGPISRKRFRTKFSQDQKEKMLELAEKLEWRMQRRDEYSINEFCNRIGVDKNVFKVWMHNNKNNFTKKNPTPPSAGEGTNKLGSPSS
ncbi:hypothetical protein M569_03334 [Genlisea aurea]|uniref:ZF-HD dimerization-type domain-containing protein n=1 Tax=Genlisea aurea TaxID=192259 RepID=S8EFN4_9LAMI|nr:hypothetical protein M569_03334 [Genlisea aurea]